LSPKVIPKEKEPIFVVHKHAATHLHYDLRLEMDGVLKSWAVPKEPPLKPGAKRLAIMVEDHSLDYADFEGVIEEGYGAGTVEIWDKGNYELVSREKDRIEVKFAGTKLKGLYLLVKFKKAGENNWLFFKAKQGSITSGKT
jgi:DNA ligase D-like protein (predicted 3'-phosphoesterase)